MTQINPLLIIFGSAATFVVLVFGMQGLSHLTEERSQQKLRVSPSDVTVVSDVTTIEKDDETATPPIASIDETPTPPIASNDELHMVLGLQIKDQKLFAEELHALQYPRDCSAARILLKGPLTAAYDNAGLSVKLQEMGKMLEVAMATGRTLVISPEWRTGYEPESCGQKDGENPWTCLWEPPTSCTNQPVYGHYKDAPSGLDASAGIRPDREQSDHFNTLYYGPQRVVPAPEWGVVWGKTWQIDVIPRWKRSHGHFWIRSQLAHFLWRPSPWLQNEINAKMPPRSVLGSEPYIAFHIRMTDNLSSFRNGFGREPSEAKSFDRYMTHANSFRERYPDMNLRTIYIATDSHDAIAESQNEEWTRQGWHFVFQREGVVRSSGEGWFDRLSGGAGAATVGIGADIEVMRRADFLVGSFQSNFYRLAAELNLAWNINRYPITYDRLKSVDVEWYEDP